MKQKKILFTLNSFPNASETFIVNQIISAIKAGYSFHILANKILAPGHSSQQFLLQKYRILENCEEHFNYSSQFSNILKEIFKVFFAKKGLGISFFLKCLRDGKFGFNGFNLYHFFRCSKLLGLKADIYHAQYGPNGIFLVEARNNGLIEGPIITTFHGYDVTLRFETHKERKLYYKPLFQSGDLFTANTQYLAEKLIDLGCPEDKLHTIPMGVDTSLFKPDLKKKSDTDTIKMLSVGRLIKLKSFEYGIMAVKELLSEGFKVHYTIIGDGDQKEYLLNLIHKLDLSSHVTLKGSLSQKLVLNHMQKNDIFLMTSTCDKQGRRETQGVVSIEAQACGLPVCAFRSGGIPYTIIDGKTGFLAAENDLKEFVLNIKKIINNKRVMLDMSRNAIKFIENNYALSVCSKKMIQCYEDELRR